MIPFLTTAFNFIPDIFLESFRWHADLSSDVEKLKELKAWMKLLEKVYSKYLVVFINQTIFNALQLMPWEILFVGHQYNAFIISYLQLVIAHCPISYLAIYFNGRVKSSSAQ